MQPCAGTARARAKYGEKEANQASIQSASAGFAPALNRRSQEKSTALGRTGSHQDQATKQRGLIVFSYRHLNHTNLRTLFFDPGAKSLTLALSACLGPEKSATTPWRTKSYAYLPEAASGVTLLFQELRSLLPLPFDAALCVNRLGPFACLSLLPLHFLDLPPLHLKDAVAFHLIH